MPQQLLSERLAVLFQHLFPQLTQQTKQGYITLTAKSGQATIELDDKPDYLTLSIIYDDWGISFVCLPKRIDNAADESLYSFSYGPGTNKKFDYLKFYHFFETTWIDIIYLMTNRDFVVPNMGVRDLATLVPHEQHWDPDSDFMYERISTILQATITNIYT